MTGLPMYAGVEQELELFAAGRKLDFRSFFHGLASVAGGVAFRNRSLAYVIEAGYVLACDEAEAEFATAPIEISGLGSRALVDEVVRCREDLLELVSAHGVEHARGYSTHLSVSLEHDGGLGIAQWAAELIGPSLTLLLEGRHSPGLLIRPRPLRLEVGSEYVDDEEQLLAATVFLAGAASALARGATAAWPRTRLGEWEYGLFRGGLYLPHGAFGESIHLRGRAARVELADGGWTTAGDVLELAAELALDELGGRIDTRCADALRAYAFGEQRLQLEDGRDVGHISRRPPPPASVESEVLAAIAGRYASLDPLFVDWHGVAFGLPDSLSESVVGVPWSELAAFVALAAADGLDGLLQDLPSSGLLSHLSQLAALARFTAVDAGRLGDQAFFDFGHALGKKLDLCTVRRGARGEIEIRVPATADPAEVLAAQEPPQNETRVAHGVWAHNGALGQHHVDHQVRSLGFDFAFTRHYRSSVLYDGVIGQGWDHSYNVRVVPEQPAAARPIPGGWCEVFGEGDASAGLTYLHGTGRVTTHRFAGWERRRVRWARDDGDGLVEFDAVVSTYEQNPGEDFEIERYALLEPPSTGALDGIDDQIFYRIRVRGGTRLLLNCHGCLIQIRDRNFNRMQLSYGGPYNPSTRCFALDRIQDTLGRETTLEYVVGSDGVPRVARLVDPFERDVTYAYDDAFQLVAVGLVDPTGDGSDDPAVRPTLVYGYDGRPGLLTSVTSPDAVAAGKPAYLEVGYDGDERVTSQRVGTPSGDPNPCGGTWNLDWSAAGTLVVTDRVQVQRTYRLRAIGDTDVVESLTVVDEIYEGDARRAGVPLETRWQHDDQFHITLVTSPGGKQDHFEFTHENGPVTAGDERDDVDADVTYFSDLARDDVTAHRVVEAGGTRSFTTTYRYEPLFHAETEVATARGTMAFFHDAGWSSSPENNGNPLTVTYPPQRIPDGAAPLPVVETYRYGPGGVRISFRDADGVEHRYDHHETGQVTEHSIGGARFESFAYDDYGNVTARTDETGATWSFGYDDADRRVTETDPLGHTATYEHDLDGRVWRKTRTIVDDPSPVAVPKPEPARPLVEVTAYDLLGNRLSLTQQATTPPGGTNAGTVSRRLGWSYDPDERLVLSETGRCASGARPDARTRYEYNRRGLVAKVTLGDVRDLTASPPDANPGITETVYDRDGRPALKVDEIRGEHVTTYDGFGRAVRESHPQGALIHREFDGVSLHREWVEGTVSTGPPQAGGTEEHHVLRDTVYELDANDRLIVRTERVFVPMHGYGSVGAVDAVVATWYTPGGRVERVRDPAGRVTTFERRFQSDGRVVTAHLPGGHRVDFEDYHGDTPAKLVTRYVADPAFPNDPAPAPQDVVTTETRHFDALGRTIAQTDGHGVTTQFAYDSLGNTRVHAGPLGRETSHFDGFGRLVERAIDKVSSDSNSRGTIRLTFAYDENDNRTAAVNFVTDSDPRQTTFGYDGRDALVRVEPPTDLQALPTTYLRRPDGRVKIERNGADRTTAYEYTAAGFLWHVASVDGTAITHRNYGTDSLGHVTWSADSNGSTELDRVVVYRTYDSVGRVVAERTVLRELSFDRSVGFEYGADHASRAVLLPYANPTVHYRFGDDGNLKRILFDDEEIVAYRTQGPDRILETARTISVAAATPATQARLPLRDVVDYDAQGRVSERRLSLADRLDQPGPPDRWLGLGYREHLEYTPADLVESREAGSFYAGPDPGNVVTTLDYDGAARLRMTRDEQGGEGQLREFDWDGFNRLRGLDTTDYGSGKRGTKRELEVNYHPAARTRTDELAGGAVGGAGLGGVSTVWNFDDRGRVTAAHTYISGVIRTPLRTFHYDAGGRLQRMETGFEHRSPDVQCEYLYDGLGRLTARLEGAPTEPLADRRRLVFLYDGNAAVLEYDQHDAQVRRYVRDLRGAIVEYEYWASGQLRTTYPITTVDGSPWLLLQRRIEFAQLPPPPGPASSALTRLDYYANKIPLVLERRTWRPFETPHVLRFTYDGSSAKTATAETSDLPVVASGARFFAEERLSFAMHRFYDESLHSFVQADAMGGWGDPKAMGNPFVYSGNNPVAYGDDGRFAVLLGIPLAYLFWAGVAGAAIAGAAYALTADHVSARDAAAAAAVGFVGGVTFAFTFGIAAIGLGAETAVGAGLGFGELAAAGYAAGYAEGAVTGFLVAGGAAIDRDASASDVLVSAGRGALMGGAIGAVSGAVFTVLAEVALGGLARLSGRAFARYAGADETEAVLAATTRTDLVLGSVAEVPAVFTIAVPELEEATVGAATCTRRAVAGMKPLEPPTATRAMTPGRSLGATPQYGRPVAYGPGWGTDFFRAAGKPGSAGGRGTGKRSIPLWVKSLEWAESRGGCRLCGCRLTVRRGYHHSVEWGHIVAFAKGGDTTFANLMALCFSCNRAMGTQSLQDLFGEWVVTKTGLIVPG